LYREKEWGKATIAMGFAIIGYAIVTIVLVLIGIGWKSKISIILVTISMILFGGLLIYIGIIKFKQRKDTKKENILGFIVFVIVIFLGFLSLVFL
jgi:4-hydroxybenzoate polyprenyltransferase